MYALRNPCTPTIASRILDSEVTVTLLTAAM